MNTMKRKTANKIITTLAEAAKITFITIPKPLNNYSFIKKLISIYIKCSVIMDSEANDIFTILSRGRLIGAGVGSSIGNNKATIAACNALSNQLMDVQNSDICGIVLCVRCSAEHTPLNKIKEVKEIVTAHFPCNYNFKFSLVKDESAGDMINVAVLVSVK